MANLEPTPDGRWHFALGPVEKWVVGLGAALIVTVAAWTANSVNGQLSAMAETLQRLSTQQAVTNSQLLSMNSQLADVPSLKLEIAKHAVQIEQNKQDVKELRQTRGLK